MIRSVGGGVGDWRVGTVVILASLSAGCGGDLASKGRAAADASIAADTSIAGIDAGDPFAEGDNFTGSDASGCPGGNLVCPIPTCTVGTTTLSGTVFDPAGKNPVYGALVYIPNGPVAALTPGTDGCTCPIQVGTYVTAAATTAAGTFTLDNAPSGRNIPLVIQSGKWRRQIVLANVPSCQNTAVAADLTRLPRDRAEGDLPQMAVLTGACDGLACFMRRVGVDASEFTGPDGGGRLHVYRGAGPGPDLAGGGGGTAGDCTGATGPCPLWSTRQELERYDAVLLGCECGANDQTKPDMTPMHDWLGEGGFVIAIHNQDTWFRNGPPDFQAVATWSTNDAPGVGPFRAEATRATGLNLQQWLAAVDALAPDGTLPIDPTHVGSSVSAVGASVATYVEDVDAGNAKYLSIETPVGGSAADSGGRYCGRAVISDAHVGAGAAPGAASVPASCDTGDLQPDEKALEFMLFQAPVACSLPTIVPSPPYP